MVTALALFPVLALFSFAVAQSRAQPFHDQPVTTAVTFAAERMQLRLSALTAVLGGGSKSTPPPGDARRLASDVANAALTEDWPLMGASLRQTDPSLAASLRSALQGLSSASGPTALTTAVQGADDRMKQAVVALEWDTGQSPVARAALLSLLLTGPGGLDDSYDKAVGSTTPMDVAMAWAALRRVHELWATLAPRVSPHQRTPIQAALAKLDEVLPSAAPSRKPDGGTSNDVEADSTRVVGSLEPAVNASLVPDRDLASLAATVQHVTKQACGASGPQAVQGFAVARFYYAGYLTSSASMLVEEQDKQVRTALAGLVQGSAPAARTCPALLDELGRVAAALGG